jgi:transposase
MKPFSLDLRQRIVDAVKAGESKASASRRFRVSHATVRNFLKLDALGSLEPRKKKKRADRKFTPDALDALKAWLEEKNDLTLKQLQKRLLADFHIQVSQPSIWDRLTAMNLAWKKNDPRLRTGSPGCPGPSRKLAGGSRRHAGEQVGVR